MLALQRFLAWFLVKFNREDEKGQSMVEYALIISLIAAVVVGILATMGSKISGLFSNIVSQL